jgi:hypothetical protein
MITIGIDPGKSGGIAWKIGNSDLAAVSMPETVHDLCSLLAGITKEGEETHVFLEKVGGYVGGGDGNGGGRANGARMFTFGQNYGEIMGVCAAYGLPVHLVLPSAWQKALSLGTSTGMSKTEWKNKLKAKAQQLFPATKLTLSTADAALIHYAAAEGLVK